MIKRSLCNLKVPEVITHYITSKPNCVMCDLKIPKVIKHYVASEDRKTCTIITVKDD